jgi:hypothetical protein
LVFVFAQRKYHNRRAISSAFFETGLLISTLPKYFLTNQNSPPYTPPTEKQYLINFFQSLNVKKMKMVTSGLMAGLMMSLPAPDIASVRRKSRGVGNES